MDIIALKETGGQQVISPQGELGRRSVHEVLHALCDHGQEDEMRLGEVREDVVEDVVDFKETIGGLWDGKDENRSQGRLYHKI